MGCMYVSGDDDDDDGDESKKKRFSLFTAFFGRLLFCLGGLAVLTLDFLFFLILFLKSIPKKQCPNTCVSFKKLL